MRAAVRIWSPSRYHIAEFDLGNGLTALRLRKLLYAATRPRLLQAIRLGVGASIEHGAAFGNSDFDFIVDVGANRGQFALFARSRFPNAMIISFEPLPNPAAVFNRVFRGDPMTRLIESAISPRRERRSINVTQHDDSSSFLGVGEVQASAFGTIVVNRVEVNCGPMSDFINPSDFSGRNLLKIDVQGFELEVLKGADTHIDRFDSVYCELSYAQLYEGQPLASEIICLLTQRGFRLAGVFNQVCSNGTPLQADMLFAK